MSKLSDEYLLRLRRSHTQHQAEPAIGTKLLGALQHQGDHVAFLLMSVVGLQAALKQIQTQTHVTDADTDRDRQHNHDIASVRFQLLYELTFADSL